MMEVTLFTITDEIIRYKTLGFKKNTIKEYNYLFKIIKEHFGNVPISEITEEQILGLYKAKFNNPVLLRKLKIKLKLIFDYSFKIYDVDNKAIFKIDVKPNRIHKTKEIYTLEEFIELDNVLKNEDLHFRVFFNLLYFTGARPNEIGALFCDDINLINNTISINKTRISSKEFNSPKTYSSTRIVSISQNVSKLLKEYLQSIPNLKNEFIFLSYRVYNAKLNELIKNNNLKKITPHGFRHSHASFLISQGIPITDIAKRLGHSSPNITLAIYSHFYDKKEDPVLKLLNAL